MQPEGQSSHVETCDGLQCKGRVRVAALYKQASYED